MNRSLTEYAVIGVLFDIWSERQSEANDWLLTDLNLDDLSDYHDLDLVVEKIDLKKFFDQIEDFTFF